MVPASIAFTGGVLQIDLNGKGQFSAAADYQIALGGVATINYNITDDTFHLS